MMQQSYLHVETNWGNSPQRNISFQMGTYLYSYQYEQMLIISVETIRLFELKMYPDVIK